MNRDELHKSWLAVSVIGLMGPGMPVKTIQSWTDKGYVQIENPNPGKYSPRLYSLANAIHLHGMHEAYRSGLSVKWASEYGKNCVKRFERIIEKDPAFDRQLASSTTEFTWALYWIFDEKMHGINVTHEGLINILKDEGRILPVSDKYNNNGHVMITDMDGLLDSLFRTYREITPEFNQKALEGRIKPFPRSWDELGFPTDPSHPWNTGGSK